MNSFNDVYGNDDAHYFSQIFWDFIEQSRLVRNELGAQSYLFDNYLGLLLRASTTEFARDAADKGFASKPPIARICAEILEGKPCGTQNPLYDRIKEYIDEHPIQYQERFTQTEFYCAILSGPMLHKAVEIYQEELDERMRYAVDIAEINNLHERICEKLADATDMDKFNEIFRHRLLLAPPATAFMQGFTNQIMLSLLHRDAETSKQVFQLILDSGFEGPIE